LEITEGLCSALKKGGNVINGLAILEIYREGMLGQWDTCLYHIILQGGLEKGLKMGGSWLVSHLISGEVICGP
jgi:hypothetical protein